MIRPHWVSALLFFATLLPWQSIKASSGQHQDQSAFLPYYAQQTFLGDLDEIKERRVLRALVSYNKTDFFIRKGRILGLQAELLHQFEAQLNQGIKREIDKTKIKFIPVPFDQLIPAVNEGRGDFIAAFLSNTSARQQQVSFVDSLVSGVNEVLVTNKAITPITTLEQLAGLTVHVLQKSSYSEHLTTINRILAKQDLAPINIKQADSYLTSEDLIEMLDAEMIQAVVVDDYKAKLWVQIFPDLVIHDQQPISVNNHIGWATRKNNPELNRLLSQFVKEKAQQGTLLGNTLFNRYYKDIKWAQATPFSPDLSSPLYHAFTKAAKQHQLDVIALVAQGYQESKFNNELVSHRGAVGIMQVMPATAKEMQVKDFRTLDGNIQAAARYMRWIDKHYLANKSLSPDNRQAMIWAAYNAGPNKFNKMLKRAREMGLDDSVWFGQVEIAAALETGRETVQYVANIYKYYLAYKLSFELAKNKPMTAPAN
ncbi:lytic transglycosylase F [Motilimonas eburnea]|uniref:transglycosylase SLT domain-containing protein n=1 Tax=Motilimonas eburnea TaxID=1737488 RepID=UPI001E341B3B|nr:lytic transglycosylase F [Motilimonas eburnea]MCE2570524.1 lytic transglycosylase F [Motilimonas eburnea]